MNDLRGFLELYKMRVREFVREPAVLFWVFGFPILLAIGLGMAFREKPIDLVPVAIVTTAQPGFRVEELDPGHAAQRLRLGKVALVVVPGPELEDRDDATNPEGVLARA